MFPAQSLMSFRALSLRVILSAAKDLLFPSPPGLKAAEKILRRLTPPQDDKGRRLTAPLPQAILGALSASP